MFIGPTIPKDYGELVTAFKAQQLRIDELEELVRHLHRGRFAAKSEKITHPGMRALFEDDIDQPDDKPDDKKASNSTVKEHTRKIIRKEIPENLPRVDVHLDVADADKKCPCCAEEMVVIHEKTSEKLHVIPAEVVVKRFIMPVYNCRKCEEVKQANMPSHPIPKAGITPETLAYILVLKYMDGLPLHRIEKMFLRHGIEISRDKMARWVISLGKLLLPIKSELHRILIQDGYFGIDETSMQVLDEKGRRPDQKSYMIVQAREGPPGKSISLFHYEQSRSAAAIEPYIKGFKGSMVSDGLSTYQSLSGSNSNISHGGCLVHARRKFAEAVKGKKNRIETAKEAIRLMKQVFEIEAELKGKAPEVILAIRQKDSKPIMDELKELWVNKIDTVPAKSLTGKALHYLKNQWNYLTKFLSDPGLVAHNNYVEQRIRPFVIGRKSWLFAQSTEGAHASATIYSLLNTAKDNGLNPYDYLCRVLVDASKSSDIESLLPFK